MFYKRAILIISILLLLFTAFLFFGETFRLSSYPAGIIFFSLLLLVLLAVTGLRKGVFQNKKIISEKKFHLIFNESYHFIGILDREGYIRDVNRTALDLIGVSLEEVMGKPFWETAWWNHSEELMKLLKTSLELAKSGETFLFEASHFDKSGNTVFVDVSIKPILDKSGRVEQIIVEGKDITRRKMTEDRIKQLRNFLKDIINSMPSHLIVVNSSLCITMVNSKVLDYLGLTMDRVTGKEVDAVYPVLSAHKAVIKASIQADEPQTLKNQKCLKEGRPEYKDITIYPLSGEGYDGAVIRVEDVTDTHLLEDLMIQSEKMLSVGGLAAGMAHEINNPLAGMIQTAEVLYDRLGSLDIPANKKAAEKYGIKIEDLKNYMEDRKIISMLESIREAGARAADIVENMLTFVKREGTAVSSRNMEQLLEKILDLAETDYDLKKHFDYMNVEIIREIEDNLPLVPCESTKIQQVILSIIKNGAEAMYDYRNEQQANGIDPEKSRMIFRLKYDRTEKMFIMEIEDNGPGMPEDVRKRVFEPFYTTKGVGKGTGLGLSVSYFIIHENHRGILSVESEVGKGSKFIIQLPVKTEKNKSRGCNMSDTNDRDITVLVIDDESIIRQVFTYYLEDREYIVLSACNGKEGMEIFDRENPDIVLTDLMMPEANGLEVLDHVSKKNPETPVVIISGANSLDDAVQALRLGAWNYLIKPVQDLNLLGYTVEECLNKAKLIRENRRYKEHLEELVRERTSQLEKRNHQLDLSRRQIIGILSQAAEYKDFETGNHFLRVSETAACIARKMGWEEEKVINLQLAAPVHDIGKIGIPDNILLKPGKLDEDEWIIMKEHCLFGKNILGSEQFIRDLSEDSSLDIAEASFLLMETAANIALSHHEYWNGKGYPMGLKGKDIPIEAPHNCRCGRIRRFEQ